MWAIKVRILLLLVIVIAILSGCTGKKQPYSLENIPTQESLENDLKTVSTTVCNAGAPDWIDNKARFVDNKLVAVAEYAITNGDIEAAKAIATGKTNETMKSHLQNITNETLNKLSSKIGIGSIAGAAALGSAVSAELIKRVSPSFDATNVWVSICGKVYVETTLDTKILRDELYNAFLEKLKSYSRLWAQFKILKGDNLLKESISSLLP